jgi:methylation protein EvaC
MIAVCHVCKGEAHLIFDFGEMPIANGFMEKPDNPVTKFHMVSVYCKTCKLFQLANSLKPEEMFNSNYPFFTGSSESMKLHFANFAQDTVETFHEAKFVVEIGSNDGTLLSEFRKQGLSVLGIEPSSNLTNLCLSRGIPALPVFFDEKVVSKIVKDYGRPDLIVGANVICHIEDIDSLFRNVSNLLNYDGVFIFEEPYLLDMLEKSSFDQIYDEHIYMFSILSVKKLAARHGLWMIDAIPQVTHGGSMRYLLSKSGDIVPSKRILSLIEKEERVLEKDSWIKAFQNSVTSKIHALRSTLLKLANEGNVVGGYAATSKSTTVLNLAQIDSKLIQFIIDSTPEKIGKFSPGTGIPIVSRAQGLEQKPNYLVLFAWNHIEEILRKEISLKESGIRFILFHPSVKIV